MNIYYFLLLNKYAAEYLAEKYDMTLMEAKKAVEDAMNTKGYKKYIDGLIRRFADEYAEFLINDCIE